MENIAEKFINEINNLDASTVLVIKIHLCTENLIDKILFKKFNANKELLSKKYSTKLDYIYKKNAINKILYNNLKNFNKIRNNYAHNLDYIIDDATFNKFYMFDYKKDLDNAKTYFDKIVYIGAVTFGAFNNFINDTMK